MNNCLRGQYQTHTYGTKLIPTASANPRTKAQGRSPDTQYPPPPQKRSSIMRQKRLQ